MKFPEASKLLPVLHRLIAIASPLQWVPLPIAECQAAHKPSPTELASNAKSNIDEPPDQQDARACEGTGKVDASIENQAQAPLQPAEEERSGAGAAQAQTAASSMLETASEGCKSPEDTDNSAPHAVHVKAENDASMQEDIGGQEATNGDQDMHDTHACIQTDGHKEKAGEKVSQAEADDEQQSYDACAMCVMQVLRTLGALAACNAEHMHEAVPLILNSKCGFSMPNMVPLQELVGHAAADTLAQTTVQMDGTVDAKALTVVAAATPSSPYVTNQQQTESKDTEKKLVERGTVTADDHEMCNQHDAKPAEESLYDRAQRSCHGARQVNIDVLKSAIERGGWGLVPENQGSDAVAQSAPQNPAAEASPSIPPHEQGKYLCPRMFLTASDFCSEYLCCR